MPTFDANGMFSLPESTPQGQANRFGVFDDQHYPLALAEHQERIRWAFLRQLCGCKVRGEWFVHASMHGLRCG